MQYKLLGLTAVILFALINTAYAQMSLIPQLGGSASQLSDEPQGFDNDARLGYQFGVSIRSGTTWYLQPGIYWLRLGSELEGIDAGDFSGIRDNVDISGLHIPILIGYHIFDFGILGLRVQAGPALTLITDVQDNEFGAEKDDFKSPIWGIKVGAGVDLLFATADLTYELGVSELFENDDVKNNQLMLNFGLKL